MPLHSIDHAGGTVRHYCTHCGYEEDLWIAPERGHVSVSADGNTLLVRACPYCAAHALDESGQPLQVYESIFLNRPSWEAGEGVPHPGSMVGTKLLGRGNVINEVVEHTEGYHLGAFRVAQVRLIRALQQHPHLAPHAPLRPDPPHLPGRHASARWDGTWQPGQPPQQTPPPSDGGASS